MLQGLVSEHDAMPETATLRKQLEDAQARLENVFLRQR